MCYIDAQFYYTYGIHRVFSRNIVLGGKIAFVGRENVKNVKKQNKICCCLGGNFKTLGGEFLPPKGPEKNTGYTLFCMS